MYVTYRIRMHSSLTCNERFVIRYSHMVVYIDYYIPFLSEKIDIDHELKRLVTLLEEEKTKVSSLTAELTSKSTECHSMKEERDGALLKSQVSCDKM